MDKDRLQQAQNYVNQNANVTRNPYWSKTESYVNQVHTVQQLTDESNINGFKNSLNDSILKDLEKEVALSKEGTKEYEKKAKALVEIKNLMSQLSTEIDSAADNAKVINKIVDILMKNVGSFNKKTVGDLNGVLEFFKEFLKISENCTKTLNKASQDYKTNMSNNLIKIKNEARDIMNALNLNKLVNESFSIKDLAKVQQGFQVQVQVGKGEFLDTQTAILNSSLQMNSQLNSGMISFADAVHYMQNASQFNMKNYSQMTALYKQVTMGTKYLNLSNQNIGSLVKATNTIGDNTYMTRQLSMIAALNNDNSNIENNSDLIDYMSKNTTSVKARYNNWESVLGQSTAIKSVADNYFGTDSGSISSLMTELMSASDIGQLSDSTKALLGITNLTDTVESQMRSGNMNVQSIIAPLLQRVANLNASDKKYLDYMNLNSWNNIGSTYAGNSNAINSMMNNAVSIADETGAASDEQRNEILDKTAKLFDTQTGIQKKLNDFTTRITKQLGELGITWSDINAGVQGIAAVTQVFMIGQSLKEMRLLTHTDANVALIAKSDSFKDSGAGSWISNKFKSLLGIEGQTSLKGAWGALKGSGKLTSLAKVGGVAAIIGSGITMASDAVTMQGTTGKGAFTDAMRGIVFGTGSTAKSSSENAKSTLGNTLKWAGMGAGIGTLFGPGLGTAIGGAIGGVVGLVAGALGTTIEDNTKATEKNSERLLKNSNDSMATNSALSLIKEEKENGKGGTGGVSYGSSNGSTSNQGGGSYPWTVTSGYGYRNPVTKNGKVISQGFHHGIDFGIPEGTKIGAAVDGIVTSVGLNGGAGYQTVIQAKSGKYYRYFHQKGMPPVQVGQSVKAGDVIGISGNTGNSSGPHLHFQVDSGSNQSSTNPEPFITSYLFNASGANWSAPNSAQMDLNTDVTTQDKSGRATVGIYSGDFTTFTKESSFPATTGKGGSEVVEVKQQNYATSDDITRLINVMQELNQSQNDQKSFLQALSGKNKFVYHS